MDAWLRTRVLEEGLLDERGLLELLAWAPFGEARLAERLWRAGIVNERTLLSLFVESGARDGTFLLEEALPPPAALGAITRELAGRCRALPLQVSRGRVLIGLLDPSDGEALEELAFFTGLAVDPRAVRASALFRALHEAYGVAAVATEPDLRARFVKQREEKKGDDDDVLPPPAGPLPAMRVKSERSAPRAKRENDRRSPLVAGIASALGGDLMGPPPTSPSIPLFGPLPRDDDAVRALVGRDSLPPQVLPVLVPPFRAAVLFLVRKDVAVGWDGRVLEGAPRDVRGVLLPLTADSAFRRAREWRMVAAGTSHRPTSVERLLFRFLDVTPPETFVVLPIVVGDETVALLYADRERGALDDGLLARARQVGTTLADGLAPLVARGTLFGPQ